MRLAGPDDIVEVIAVPGDEAPVFDAADRLTDAELLHGDDLPRLDCVQRYGRIGSADYIFIPSPIAIEAVLCAFAVASVPQLGAICRQQPHQRGRRRRAVAYDPLPPINGPEVNGLKGLSDRSP